MIRIRNILSLLILLLMCFFGCHDPLAPQSQIPISIKTDKTQYNINEDDSVKVTITNKSPETIFYSTCFAKTIEVLKNDNVIENLGTPVCYCLCPAELKPGESIPVWISSLSTDIFKSRAENLLSGESVSYQIRYSLFYDEAFGEEPVLDKHSRSNRFRLIGIENNEQ